eukprot:TRINITY_DN16345_c0_g1_i1.p1 TRINITY_DN16345_c0_g1~~TRINITY_DN16345_c0_g1_i1.p1  ORF type:complete len:607 (+),score=74.31 TRINITY_DN16345_c0_g1_i1:91-1911(+)
MIQVFTRFEWKYEGNKVGLTGSFNNWSVPVPMEKENGVWTVIVPLSPGTYQYKFVVDDVHWYFDMGKDHKVDHSGIINNFIIVQSPPSDVPLGQFVTLMRDPVAGKNAERKPQPQAPTTPSKLPFPEPLFTTLSPIPYTSAHFNLSQSQPPIQNRPHARSHATSSKSLDFDPYSTKLYKDQKRYQNKPNLLNDSQFEPGVTKNIVSPKLKVFRTKYNSTASLFIDHNATIIDPDLEKTLEWKSLALHGMMKEYETRKPQKFNKSFCEAEYLKRSGVVLEPSGIPEKKEIHDFLTSLYHNAQLPGECAIMALAYIERFLTLTDITFHTTNYKLIVLGAVIIARKVWIDQSRVSNINFVKLFPYLTIDDLAFLEREYLSDLQFVVSMKPSIYAKYYFALSSIAEKNEENFPLKPLSREDEEYLESLTHNVEKMAKRNRKRSASLSDVGSGLVGSDVSPLRNYKNGALNHNRSHPGKINKSPEGDSMRRRKSNPNASEFRNLVIPQYHPAMPRPALPAPPPRLSNPAAPQPSYPSLQQSHHPRYPRNPFPPIQETPQKADTQELDRLVKNLNLTNQKAFKPKYPAPSFDPSLNGTTSRFNKEMLFNKFV